MGDRKDTRTDRYNMLTNSPFKYTQILQNILLSSLPLTHRYIVRLQPQVRNTSSFWTHGSKFFCSFFIKKWCLADQRCWELMDSGAPAREPSWNWPRPSECGWQLYNLVCLWSSQQWDQDLFQALELVLGTLFPMLGCLSQPWCRERSLVLPQFDVVKLCWRPREDCRSLSGGWGEVCAKVGNWEAGNWRRDGRKNCGRYC